MGDYGFTFGELSSNSSHDGYGGLFVKFRNNITINETNYVSGEKKPAILFDMRTTPIDWGEVTSPLLVNGNGLAVNKLTAPNVGLDIGTSDAIRVPVGTTTERPTGAIGYIRYNSTTNDFEGYKESDWTSLTSGGSEVSLNTSSYDYLSISSGTITLGQIDITDDTNLVIGTGLTLSGDTLSVDAAQSGITSVGTLSSLNVSGNVGIGTSSPTTTLDVNGPIHIGPLNTGSTDPARLQIEVDKDLGGYGGIEFRSQHPQGGDSSGATWVSKCGIYYKRGTNTTQYDYNSGYFGAGSLHFAIESVEDGTTDVNIDDSIMTIHNDGYVGIGTSSPSCKLHLVDSSSEGKIIIENETLALLQLKQPTSSKTYNIELGRTDGELTFRSTTGERMRLTESGNLGIGITTPQDSLHINGNIRLASDSIIWAASGTHNHNNGNLKLRSGGNGTSSSAVHAWSGTGAELEIDGDYDDGYFRYTHNSSTKIHIKGSNGYVGIGTTSPSFSLHIVGGGLGNSGVINDTSAYYIGHDGFGANNLPPTSSGHNFATSSYRFSLYCTKSIFSERYIAASDSRIKDNIENIPDDTALQIVRDIPCRYYTYRDVVDRGYNRTIGFIAQEVKDVIPEAVDEISEYIPDEYRLLTASNKQWSYTNGEYHLKVTDLEITPNSSYRFIVGNNDGIDQETLEIEPNSDDTFTFSKTWSKIFLYGKLVNDFNVLDKQKIFAVHHAAIQELDRINTDQAQRIQTLETQLADVIARLTALENA